MKRFLCWLAGHKNGTKERQVHYRDGTSGFEFECARCGKSSDWPLR